MDVLDVLGRAHEGQGDEVGILLDTPAQILLVLLGQGGDGDGDARQVKALVVRDHAGNLDAGNDVGIGDLDDADRDVTVVDQQAVAGSAVTGQALERRTDEFLGAGNVAGRDGEGTFPGGSWGPGGRREPRSRGRTSQTPSSRAK